MRSRESLSVAQKIPIQINLDLIFLNFCVCPWFHRIGLLIGLITNKLQVAIIYVDSYSAIYNCLIITMLWQSTYASPIHIPYCEPMAPYFDHFSWYGGRRCAKHSRHKSGLGHSTTPRIWLAVLRFTTRSVSLACFLRSPHCVRRGDGCYPKGASLTDSHALRRS